MNRLAGRLALAPLSLASCMTTWEHPDVDVWPGVDEDTVHHLGEGGGITVDYGADYKRRVVVANGRLLLVHGHPAFEQDLGPYRREQALRFHDDGRLTVDGETRVRVGLP